MKTKISITGTATAAVLLSFTQVLFCQKTDTLRNFQDTTATLLVRLNEGSRYVGKFASNRGDTLSITTTELGLIHISYSKIKSLQRIAPDRVRKGVFWFEQPLSGRYFLAPSAFMLSPGEGYYQNTMVLLNSFNVGVTRWFSVGGGLEFYSTIATLTMGDFQPTFYLTPKFGVKVARTLRLGAGILYAQVLGDQYSLGTFYGLITWGTSDYNLTGGLGLGFSRSQGSEWEWQKNPMITICGTARISRTVAFLTENWILPGAGKGGSAYPLFSYGLRFMRESICFDLALINNQDIVKVFIIGVPFVSFTVKF